jgi:hypothetical protein
MGIKTKDLTPWKEEQVVHLAVGEEKSEHCLGIREMKDTTIVQVSSVCYFMTLIF